MVLVCNQIERIIALNTHVWEEYRLCDRKIKSIWKRNFGPGIEMLSVLYCICLECLLYVEHLAGYGGSISKTPGVPAMLELTDAVGSC